MISLVLAVALAGGASIAQPAATPAPSPSAAPVAAATIGVVPRPCDVLEPQPPAVKAFDARVAAAKANHLPPPEPSAEVAAASKAWWVRRTLDDFGDLCRYRKANAALPPATSHRVVFIGDSITESWGEGDPTLFTHDVIDRGISGQTTPQMVLRFRADVLDLKPAVVHILAGTNDIAGNTGPTSLEAMESNIKTMVELAQAHHVRVILGSLTPVARYPWRPSIEPVQAILAFNHWLKTYAHGQGLIYVDYFTPLDDGHHGFKAKLSVDGVHPDPAGFAVMSRLARQAVIEAQSAAPR